MTTFKDGLFQYGGSPVGSYGNAPIPRDGGQVWFVDGDKGLDGNSGRTPGDAFKTIGAAISATNVDLNEGDTVYVFPKTFTSSATDPASYAETVIIAKPQVSLIGIGNSRTQGGLPQMKIGAGTTPMITIRAGGVTIANMGINGASSTGGGIEIDQNAAGSEVIGTAVLNCHIKNCKKHATNGTLGGGVYWSADGGGWQTLIKGNRFYKCLNDIALLGTNHTRPQDVIIEGNHFSGPAASVDINIYLAGGSGINGVHIHDNVFPCWPAIGAGTKVMPLDLLGCTGILSRNVFAATGKTAGAAGNMLVPTTVLMADNYQEDGATQWART